MWRMTVFPPSDRTLEVLSAQKIADTGEGLKKGRAERTEILEGWRKQIGDGDRSVKRHGGQIDEF